MPAARSLWLELDLDREPPARPVPGLCAGLAGAVPSERSVGALLALLALLRGRPLAASTRLCLARCLAAIPPPGRLLYAASMESRRAEEVRLVVAGLDPPALLSYLRRVAPGEVARRAAAMAPLLAGAARTHLSFDVGDEVGPRVGLECSFSRLPSREPGWSAILARWTEAGLATAEERRALLAWTGQDSAWTAAPRWPERRLAEPELAGARCIRCLSHLKLVAAPERPPAAKAYLLFGPWKAAVARPAARLELGTGTSLSVT